MLYMHYHHYNIYQVLRSSSLHLFLVADGPGGLELVATTTASRPAPPTPTVTKQPICTDCRGSVRTEPSMRLIASSCTWSRLPLSRYRTVTAATVSILSPKLALSTCSREGACTCTTYCGSTKKCSQLLLIETIFIAKNYFCPHNSYLRNSLLHNDEDCSLLAIFILRHSLIIDNLSIISGVIAMLIYYYYAKYMILSVIEVYFSIYNIMELLI